ncbi:hypothetical protein PWP93_35595 [Paraburkholderia sp. A1RI-2L]|uniref:hypothetical protein n=1 Tax=Paraburkholderia sp. A1RI-2L TaxID=3028367 RepID=UPI003B7C7C83
MKDIDREIDGLWKRINLMQAQADAMMTVLQAAMPTVENSPTFAASVREIFDARMANRLCRGVDEAFVDEYVSSLKAIVPKHLSGTLTLRPHQ